MELYPWVRALQRFAHNLHEALPCFLKIAEVIEMAMYRIVIFGGSLYGVYAFGHGH